MFTSSKSIRRYICLAIWLILANCVAYYLGCQVKTETKPVVDKVYYHNPEIKNPILN